MFVQPEEGVAGGLWNSQSAFQPAILATERGLLYQYCPPKVERRPTSRFRLPTWLPCSFVGDRAIDQLIPTVQNYLIARPDIQGVYCLNTCPESYQILWCDVDGPVASRRYTWNEIHSLIAYIYSLYIPPATHSPPDTSVRLVCDSAISVPRWDIVYGDQLYKGCLMSHCSEPWGRRMVCFSHSTSRHNFAMIKDVYWNPNQQADEITLLREIHQNGLMPGVVRLVHSPSVQDTKNGPVPTAMPHTGDTTVRQRRRLCFGSEGLNLTQARSVRDLLMAIFDAIEGKSRWQL